MIKRLNNPLFIFYAFSIALTYFSYPKYTAWMDNTPFKYDAAMYYSYVEAAFVYNDLTFSFPGSENYGFSKSENGRNVPKMTMGVSLFQTPFFFLADHIARAQGYPLNGHSEPYKWIIHFGALFYVLSGFYFLYYGLLNFINKWISILTCFAILYGTNLFYYSFGFNQMSHGYLFFLGCLIMYTALKWNTLEDVKYLYCCSFFIGFATLVRPTEVVWALVPLLIGTINSRSIKARFAFFFNNKKVLISCISFFLIPLMPQLFFWKIQTGKWFFYSYNDEGFFFFDPKFFQTLLSYHNGMLPYSPLLIFAIFGIIAVFFKQRNIFNMSLVFFIINTYILSSWWI